MTVKRLPVLAIFYLFASFCTEYRSVIAFSTPCHTETEIVAVVKMIVGKIRLKAFDDQSVVGDKRLHIGDVIAFSTRGKISTYRSGVTYAVLGKMVSSTLHYRILIRRHYRGFHTERRIHIDSGIAVQSEIMPCDGIEVQAFLAPPCLDFGAVFVFKSEDDGGVTVVIRPVVLIIRIKTLFVRRIIEFVSRAYRARIISLTRHYYGSFTVIIKVVARLRILIGFKIDVIPFVAYGKISTLDKSRVGNSDRRLGCHGNTREFKVFGNRDGRGNRT